MAVFVPLASDGEGSLGPCILCSADVPQNLGHMLDYMTQERIHLATRERREKAQRAVDEHWYCVFCGTCMDRVRNL